MGYLHLTFGQTKQTLRWLATVPAGLSCEFSPGRNHWPAGRWSFALPLWQTGRGPTGGRESRPVAKRDRRGGWGMWRERGPTWRDVSDFRVGAERVIRRLPVANLAGRTASATCEHGRANPRRRRTPRTDQSSSQRVRQAVDPGTASKRPVPCGAGVATTMGSTACRGACRGRERLVGRSPLPARHQNATTRR